MSRQPGELLRHIVNDDHGRRLLKHPALRALTIGDRLVVDRSRNVDVPLQSVALHRGNGERRNRAIVRQEIGIRGLGVL